MVIQRVQAWDKIQISLKCWLPSYQPILSDSVVVSSLLSDQNQKLNCADFEQICGRVITTMNEIIQEDEIPDPEIQAQSQKIQVQHSPTKSSDHKTDPDPKIQISGCEISEGDAAMVQNATEVTDPAPIQQSNPENPSEINEDKFEVQYSDSGISNLENGASKISEITASTTPQFNSEKQNKSDFQSQNDEDGDELDVRTLYQELADRNATVVVERPPPKPPDLHSVAVGEGEPGSSVIKAEGRSRRPENLETVTAIHSSAEDGAVAKGNVDDDTTDLKHSGCVGNGTGAASRSADVGAFADDKESLTEGVVIGAEGSASLTGTVKNLHYGDGDRRTSGGQKRPRRRVFPFFGKPPILLAVVLPWNRGGGRPTGGWFCGSMTMMERRSNRSDRREMEPGMTATNSLDGREGFLSVAEGTSGFSHAIGGWCIPGPAVVELAEAWWKQVVGSLFDGVSFLLHSEKENQGRMGEGSIGLGDPNLNEPGPIRKRSLGNLESIAFSKAAYIFFDFLLERNALIFDDKRLDSEKILSQILKMKEEYVRYNIHLHFSSPST
ncbi:hypothetical protein PIB30_001465 [Stylosanthes scabra]|uniref:DUF4283 domain-containing protein n=1 Tax=Stylosanthes scabra TaxID=79078 RepID=A0ABU6Q2G9_9FABA|nr:hypothetical protein [Stylosanthes scabra]